MLSYVRNFRNVRNERNNELYFQHQKDESDDGKLSQEFDVSNESLRTFNSLD